MPKKATVSEKSGETSQLSIESNIEKSPSSSITSPPSKLSNITKFLRSPRQDEKPKQTKSKTKKSTRKGKSKNIDVEGSSNVSGSNTPKGGLSSDESASGTKVIGNTSITTTTQEQDFIEQEGQIKKGASSIPCETEDQSLPGPSKNSEVHITSPGPARGEDISSSSGLAKERDISTTPGQEKGEDSGKRRMVQANLSMTKKGLEVISSPEQMEKKKGKKPSSKKKDDSGKKQTRITNIFPLRKSNRKTKSQQEKDEQARITKAILSQTFDGLEVRTTEGKGRGVFASRNFQRNEFVCEYSGELISYAEAKKREKQYGEDTNIGCYMYYLSCNNKKYCIDATAEDGTLGRLLNHSRSGNCKTKVHMIEEKPHLIFVTTRHVKDGEELTYDYGDRDKDVLESHPWLKY